MKWESAPLAMVYIPWQYMNEVFENLCDALQAGTLFPELEKPFMRGCCHDVRK
ncbi:MAG: spore coat associated protein CotJA [Lachnospiraceae bacterium]|nr:spore coat associated protein CotJA [Lachnospiraceae bacterium]